MTQLLISICFVNIVIYLLFMTKIFLLHVNNVEKSLHKKPSFRTPKQN